MSKRAFAASIALAGLVMTSGATATEEAEPNRGAVYEVRITNITRGQTFTPILLATHTAQLSMFTLGEPASAELAFLAEDGNPAPLGAALASTGQTLDVRTIDGLLAPGRTATMRVRANGRFDRLSVAAMLIPTNDTFFAANSIPLPEGRHVASHVLVAYDSGSEANDERCARIPGPMCGGQGASPTASSDEGFVHISAGIHGVGDLRAGMHDWRNPVARLTVRRVQ